MGKASALNQSVHLSQDVAVIDRSRWRLDGDLLLKACILLHNAVSLLHSCPCGYWTVQTGVYVYEPESPLVLFVLIKQPLDGTLDTLDQTPSHY